MNCPHCKKNITLSNTPDISTAMSNVEAYGSSIFNFRCPNNNCKKMFSLYIRRTVQIDYDSIMAKEDSCQTSF